MQVIILHYPPKPLKTQPEYITVHNSRTMMFAELEAVLDHAMSDDSYLESLNENITGKTTGTNRDKTKVYLKRLYDFDQTNPAFLALKHYWKIASAGEKPVLALIYALNKDFLLRLGMDIIRRTDYGQKAAVELFENAIESHYPGRYSPNSLRSNAQNIASSWKQAGFLKGKISNIRVPVQHTYRTVAFAALLLYLRGKRGEYILSDPIMELIHADASVQDLLKEASKRDLLNYQQSGHVVTIHFDQFIANHLNHGIQS